MRRKAREYAVQGLFALDLNPQPVPEFLKLFWEMNPCREGIQDYASILISGTMSKRKEIDALISSHSSNWKIDRMAVTDRNILRLGTFELLEERSVPSSVVINEAIEIAKKYGTTDSATFINGVLDSIHHEIEDKEPRHVS